jgi:cytochrome c-type biogenesis protein CcmH/NrfG
VELGKTLQASGRADEACSAFRHAVRLQPGSGDALAGIRALSCR